MPVGVSIVRIYTSFRGGFSPAASPRFYPMSSLEAAFDMEVKGFRSTDSSFYAGGHGASSDGTASFYQADLDKVQRRLSGVHVHMYVSFPLSAVSSFMVSS